GALAFVDVLRRSAARRIRAGDPWNTAIVNIDLVQPKFKPPTGAERFILSLGRALAARGCRVRVVCHQFDPLCRPLAEGLTVDESGLRLEWSGNHYLDSIASYARCFQLRRRLAVDADVVCLFGP